MACNDAEPDRRRASAPVNAVVAAAAGVAEPRRASAPVAVVPGAEDAADKTLKNFVFKALCRLSAPVVLSTGDDVGTPPGAPGAPGTPGGVGPVRATWRLFIRTFAVDRRLQTRAEMLHQALIDLALTKEQQEVFEKVLACNVRFWQIAVEGELDGRPPWQRHVALNLALLRVLHRYLAAQRVADALMAPEVGEAADQLTLQDAEEALKYCQWTLALYDAYAITEEPSSDNSREEELQRTVLQLVQRSAAAAEAEAEADAAKASRERFRVLSSDLDNEKQCSDPLCPRFVLAMDVENSELILCVRGTQSLSDLFADLIGDTEDFAGGQAHAGILRSSQRLLEKIITPVQEGLEQLPLRTRRLVLVGHSLGAGVCQLLAVLLLVGDGHWNLPQSVPLRCFLFAPPPVFGLEPKARSWSSFDLRHVFRHASDAATKVALERVRRASVAFTVNFDIIPRTSLHNGYKLFQEARLLDDAVPYSKAEVLRRLGATGLEEVLLASELQHFMAQSAKTKPAPTNPYAAQHAIADRLFQLMLVPGGTSMPRSGTPELRGANVAPAAVGAASGRGRLQKRSQHLKLWRSRYAWIEAGELRFAPNENDEPTTRIPLTADSTSVTLIGDTSEPLNWSLCCSLRPTPAAPGTASGTAGSGGNSGSGRRSFLGDLTAMPTVWGFKVQTDAQWAGLEPVNTSEADAASLAFPKVLCCEATEVVLCAESAEDRRRWLQDLAAELGSARQRCLRVCPAVSPEDFGHEALLAEGLQYEHNANRYALALQAAIDQIRTHQ